MTIPRIILESPYAGDVERNLLYARLCLRDSLLRGEAPLASHLLYTQAGVLDDSVPLQRALGIAASHAWMEKADYVAIYENLGLSPGMEQGLKLAQSLGKAVVFRALPKEFL